MDGLFIRLFDIFSLEYMFSVIIATYFLIKLIDILNVEATVPTWQKRLVTFAVGTAAFVIFRKFTDIPTDSLIASYFAALFVYDTAIKFLIKKFNVDYKKC